MSAKLRIGVVPYLNALPLIEGLPENPAILLHYATPAELEGGIDRGDLDGALLPVSALLSRPHLSMFSFSGIAADHEAGSVLFFSRSPKIRRVAYDEGSRTSVLLLRLLFQEQGIAPPDWVAMPPNLDNMLQDADGALLIGDVALTMRRDHRFDFDLVERWRRWTNFPFVFAVWAARADHPRRPEMTKLFTDASIQGLSRLDSIAHRKAGVQGMSAWEILTYYKKNMVYRLGKPHLDGLELFAAKCKTLPMEVRVVP